MCVQSIKSGLPNFKFLIMFKILFMKLLLMSLRLEACRVQHVPTSATVTQGICKNITYCK